MRVLLILVSGRDFTPFLENIKNIKNAFLNDTIEYACISSSDNFSDLETVIDLKYKEVNKKFQLSKLYLDLDLDEPTYNTLCNLWDKVVPGGYIVFDEYEYHKFDESNGVDRFFKERKIIYTIISTNFYAPTAYIIKQ
jgi:hypothetical protein